MSLIGPEDELTDIRNQVRRLLARELELQARISAAPNTSSPVRRPGWPIRRVHQDAVKVVALH